MSGEDWIAQARAQGLAPAEDGERERPWPVVLLTALGAWLAVPPFIALFWMLFGQAWDKGLMPYVEGGGLMALAVVLLRGRATPLFLEQAAMPLLLTGGVCLGFGLERDLPHAAAALAGLAIGTALIALLRQGWLRVLLGVGMAALSACLVHLALKDVLPGTWYRAPGRAALVQGEVLLAIGWAAWVAQECAGRSARRAALAAALEPVLRGWWIAVLALLALAAGRSFVMLGAAGGGGVGGLIVDGPTETLSAGHLWAGWVARGLSAGVTLAAAAWIWRRWRPAGAARLLPPVLVLAGLAALMPPLGGLLLVLALMVTTRRWRLAVLAGVAAVWAIGALYYEWSLPLAHKSVALVVAGAALAVWVRWLSWHPEPEAASGVTPDRPSHVDQVDQPDSSVASAHPVRGGRGAAAWLGVAAVLVLAVVNVGIAGRERLIAEGRTVFVKLAPVDPRSMMQGDYMRLDYDLPIVRATRWMSRVGANNDGPLWGSRLRIAVTLDARGVVVATRLLDEGQAPPAGTQVLQLTPKDGGWTLVSDAWFFREGEAQRWQPAKYGEFRVTPDGKGLLVGVVGEDLKPL